MSLNSQYIINGSTLSDIGEALRNKGIINPVSVDETKTCYYKEETISASGSDTNTLTINNEYFQNLSETPEKVLIVFTASNSVSINGETAAIPLLNTDIIYDLPLTISISGSTLYPGNSYSFSCKIFPLNRFHDIIIPSPTTGYSSESKTLSILQTVAVEDIASTINNMVVASGDNIAFIWPFKIDNRNAGTPTSTDLSSYISDITDIKALYFLDYSYNLYRLIPSTAQTTVYTYIGNYTNKTTYRAQYYNFNRNTGSNWQTTLDNSSNFV
jgi:hypothetical protein